MPGTFWGLNREAGLPRRGRQAAGSPIWFIVEDGVLIFNAGKNTARGRALARLAQQGSAKVYEDPVTVSADAITVGQQA